jgi:hypothetical protein
MKHSNSYSTSGFILGLTAAALAMSPSTSRAASPSDNQPATASSAHSHAAMQPMARLQPKRVVTVTGKEDWDELRGFGKDSAMAEMMTLMMVGGSGMEHMKMAPMKRGNMPRVGIERGAMAMGATRAPDQQTGLNVNATVSPNPPIVGDNTLDITVTDARRKPVTGLKLTTSVAMTSMDMGTEHPKVVEGQAGHYTMKAQFSMTGPWRVTLTLVLPNQKPFTRAFDFDVKE